MYRINHPLKPPIQNPLHTLRELRRDRWSIKTVAMILPLIRVRAIHLLIYDTHGNGNGAKIYMIITRDFEDDSGFAYF